VLIKDEYTRNGQILAEALDAGNKKPRIRWSRALDEVIENNRDVVDIAQFSECLQRRFDGIVGEC
jgi:hypothetical protein